MRNLILSILLCSVAQAGPKNLVLVLADGLGPQQKSLLLSQDKSSLKELAAKSKLFILQPGNDQYLVNDTAGTVSLLATGKGSRPESLSLDVSGNPSQTILEAAKASGKSVGVVTDTKVTSPASAAFLVHQLDSSNEEKVAQGLVKAKVDILIGAGREQFSSRTDGSDLLVAAEEAGFYLARSREGLKKSDLPVLGLFSERNAIDVRNAPSSSEPSLEELAKYSLDKLDADEEGFVLILIAGQIDFAASANDAGWLLAEMEKFDRLLKVILNWSEGREDTLFVVSSSGESGGFSFSSSNYDTPRDLKLNYQPLKKLELLRGQKRTLSSLVNDSRSLSTVEGKVNKLKLLLARDTRYVYSNLNLESVFADNGVGHYYPRPEQQASAKLASLLSLQQGVTWSGGTKTGTPVVGYLFGNAPDSPSGVLRHNELGAYLKEALLSKNESASNGR